MRYFIALMMLLLPIESHATNVYSDVLGGHIGDSQLTISSFTYSIGGDTGVCQEVLCHSGESYPEGTNLSVAADIGASEYFDKWVIVIDRSGETSEHREIHDMLSLSLEIEGDEFFIELVTSDTPPEPEPQKTPVILIHGIIGSMSTELFCGDQDQADDFSRLATLAPSISEFSIANQWTIDPILKSYDKLISDLQLDGFPVEVFAYDWRREIPVIVTGNTVDLEMPYLTQKIDEVKAKYSVEQVDIVAHSMGGLVTREYIQNHYRGDIRKFIMIGTPNAGALDGYRTWQAGNFKMSAPLGASLMENLLENMKTGCGGSIFENDIAFVRSTLPSVKQLLPAFDYFRYESDSFTQFVRPVWDMCHKNTYLTGLNGSAYRLVDQGISILVIASDNKVTKKEFRTTKSPRKNCDRQKWTDRKPGFTLKTDLTDGGDGRVLIASAHPADIVPAFEQIPLIKVRGKHDKLPKRKDVIRHVREYLNRD